MRPTDRQVGVAPTGESWAQIPLYQVASCMSLGKSLSLPELGFLIYNVGLSYHQNTYHPVDPALGLACIRQSVNLNQDHEAHASHTLSSQRGALTGWASRSADRGSGAMFLSFQ